MAEFHFDNLAKNLPEVYKKDESSNNFKILEIERLANEDLRQTLESISAALNIDNAKGAVLDMYGARYGQARGKATDAQYIAMIKSKVVRSLSSGSYKDIVDAICYTFGCDKSEVLLVETDTPMSVRLEKAPLGAVIRAGFSSRQAEQIVERLLPVAVTLDYASLEGTFEFAETETEYDETKGFSESENGTIGGYLGWTGSEESIDELPI